MFGDDGKLLARLRRGDREAYAEAAERFHREIWAYLFRLTRDYDLSEDLAQEVAIKFWQAAPEFRGVSALKAWVYKVAYNTFAANRRTRRLECAALDEDVPSTSPAHNPAALLERQVVQEEIEAALGLLPEEQRQAIILTKVQGLKLREAAEVMETPTGTVQWRVAEGLKKLRKILLKQEVDHVVEQTSPE